MNLRRFQCQFQYSLQLAILLLCRGLVELSFNQFLRACLRASNYTMWKLQSRANIQSLLACTGYKPKLCHVYPNTEKIEKKNHELVRAKITFHWKIDGASVWFKWKYIYEGFLPDSWCVKVLDTISQNIISFNSFQSRRQQNLSSSRGYSLFSHAIWKEIISLWQESLSDIFPSDRYATICSCSSNMFARSALSRIRC